MTDLQRLTTKELKQFISEHRKDDEKCSAALEELLNRDRDGVVYPANLPEGEMARIWQEKFDQERRSQP